MQRRLPGAADRSPVAAQGGLADGSLGRSVTPTCLCLGFFGRVEKKERARLKTVKFNSKARGDKGVSLDDPRPPSCQLPLQMGATVNYTLAGPDRQATRLGGRGRGGVEKSGWRVSGERLAIRLAIITVFLI